jgi:hypothetical protein
MASLPLLVRRTTDNVTRREGRRYYPPNLTKTPQFSNLRVSGMNPHLAN